MATPSGKRSVGSLKVGDSVLAYNPTTGQTDTEPIQHVWINHDHDLMDVGLMGSAVAQRASATSASADATSRSGSAPTTTSSPKAPSGLSHVLRALPGVVALGAVALVVTLGNAAPVVQAAAVPVTATSTSHIETVHTTANHPWLTADRGWVEAGNLQPGESVVTLSGVTDTVAWVHVVAGQADMYNLTVAKDHTYAVGDGQYVVHNDDVFPPGLPPYISALQWRTAPGTAWGGGDLVSVYSVADPGDFFVQGGGARILVPREVAQQLQGNFYADGFGTFDSAFRSDFWKAMYNVPEMRNLFSPSNQTLMARGRAPFAPQNLSYARRAKYEINHIDPIEEGGSPLDLSNMEVLAPQTHVQYHQQLGQGAGDCLTVA